MEKIAFLFPGQGSQYVGMSKTFYDRFDVVKQTFEEANDILGFDLARLCFQGSLAELSKMENALVALLTSSVSAFRVYMKEIGVAPQFCAGHSLGEYSALTCSGAIQFSDAVKVVLQRAKLAKEIADTGTSAMTIISGVDPAKVEEDCKRVSNVQNTVGISCYNSSNEVAIAGQLDAVQAVEDWVLEMGGQITPLIGTAPFHSSLMQPVVGRLKQELEKYTYRQCIWPVISNVTALPHEDLGKVVDLLTRQIIQPVQWQRTIHFLQKYGITMTIEMGAKNVLSNLNKIEAPQMKVLSFDQKLDRRILEETLLSDERYKKHIPTVITKCLAIAAATPNYNPDTEEYRKGVLEPLRRIQQIQEEIEKEISKPTQGQMRQAAEMLRTIFTTKRISAEEQEEWFHRIENETGTNYLLTNG